jgi:glutamyl-tRNA synthetase
MVDDHLMGITHVIRGSEWLSTFPLHVHILRAFGWSEPTWVHLSLLLKPSGKGKMSKREMAQALEGGHSIFIQDLAELGYLPEGVINWAVLMGWSYDDHSEFFTLPDLVNKFSLEKLNPAPAAINFSKLDHFNGLHIRALDQADLSRRLVPFFRQAGYEPSEALLRKIIPVIRERIVTLDDGPEVARIFFEEAVQPTFDELVGKNMTPAQSADMLRQALTILDGLPEFTQEAMEEPLRLMAQQSGFGLGPVFGLLRIAVTGRKVSPPLFESMEILGREKVLSRLRTAQNLLSRD